MNGCKIPYKERYTKLADRFDNLVMQTRGGVKNFHLIKSKIVDNEEQAYEFYNECIAAGEEGSILKNIDFKWEPKRVKGVGKMKAVEEIDLIVTGIIPGTGKYTGMLGAFECQTRDGKLKVNVGTGFSDAQRKDYNTEDMLSKIVTVCYNQIITDKKKETASLFLPRFIEIREDKDVANSIEEIK